MIKKLCIFTISFAFDRQGLINFIEEIIPSDIELFLFVSKECKGKYYSTRIKIIESKSSKYLCFRELRKFCRKNDINRVFTLGALPQEGFIATISTLMTKTDFIPYLVVNPYKAFLLNFNKHTIKAFFEFLGFYLLIPFPKKFCVITEPITNLSKRFFPFFKNKILHLKYPVKTEVFKKDNKEKIRKRLNLEKNQKIAIFVGRIEYNKGSDMILQVAKDNPNILFILIGKVTDKNIEKENLHNIKLIEKIDSNDLSLLSDYYNAADFCFFPSRIESFGLVPREAMSCGVPAIVSDITAFKKLEPAIKFPLIPEEINKRINEFFNLTEKQKKILSEKSRKFIIDNFSEEVCKESYLKNLLS